MDGTTCPKGLRSGCRRVPWVNFKPYASIIVLLLALVTTIRSSLAVLAQETAELAAR